MFESLFLYSPELFSRGELTFLAGPVRLALVALGALGVVWVLFRYRPVARSGAPEGSSRRAGAVIVALRALGLATLVFILLEPALALQAVRPRESFLAVVTDDSASMKVADLAVDRAQASTRAEWVGTALWGSDEEPTVGPLWQRLAERFQLRGYAFGEEVRRTAPGEVLTFDGRSSDVGRALGGVLSELSGVPLAGVVLITDGALGSSDELGDQLLRYRAAGVPVFPLVLGSPGFERDLEIEQIVVPDRSLLGSSVDVEVQVAYPGFAGESVVLEVRDEGRVVEQREVELPLTGDETTKLTASIRSMSEGTRLVEVQVRPADSTPETVARNNQRRALLEVEPGPRKILYFEGEPRFEYKFLRRAVEEDPQIQLVSLLRMAENRFYRQSVDDESELQGGFPTRREDLFRYRGLVLGSVEASFFTYEQMRMIVDFASERGGGVLFLGGARSLGEGGYAGTPLAELVPVGLSDLREVGPSGVPVVVEPTQLGRLHPALQLGEAMAEEDPASDGWWTGLPELLVINRTGPLKAGAAALLAGQPAAGGTEQLVLAHQQFGAGSSMLFTPTDSFRWQMRMELEDQTHEVMWRQLLRWLVSGVEDRFVVRTSSDLVEVGESVAIEATVRDERFRPDSDAMVSAVVTAPSGATEEVDLSWEFQPRALYSARVSPLEEGIHSIDVTVRDAAGATLRSSARFRAGPMDREFFAAHRREEVLRSLVEETGGRLFEADQADDLLEALSYSTAGITVREEKPLWNMPILLLALLTCLAGEWILRRWKGLR